jgi:predicted aspartyl protease
VRDRFSRTGQGPRRAGRLEAKIAAKRSVRDETGPPASCLLLVLLPLFSICPSFSASANAQLLPESPLQVQVRVTGQALMVVPVRMNGRGPYDFLLDTGSTATMVDEKFAEEIGLLLSGRTTIVSTQEGEATMFTAEADSVSVGGARVRQLTIGVVKSLASVPVKVRGVLGEDFLRNFDLLLDYQHHLLQFDSSPASLAEMLTGERVSLRLLGDDGFGTVSNRLILTARIPDLTLDRVKLLLDTGTNVVVLYGPRLHLPDARGNALAVSGNAVSAASTMAGSWQRTGSIALGDKTTAYLPTVVLSVRRTSDVDGLLPASAFHSIFISHSGEFVLLNPSIRLTLSQAGRQGARR